MGDWAILFQLPPPLLERLRRHLQQLLGHGQHFSSSRVGIAGHAVVRGSQAPPPEPQAPPPNIGTEPKAPAYCVVDGPVVRRREFLAARLRDIPAEFDARGPRERDEVRGVG